MESAARGAAGGGAGRESMQTRTPTPLTWEEINPGRTRPICPKCSGFTEGAPGLAVTCPPCKTPAAGGAAAAKTPAQIRGLRDDSQVNEFYKEYYKTGHKDRVEGLKAAYERWDAKWKKVLPEMTAEQYKAFVKGATGMAIDDDGDMWLNGKKWEIYLDAKGYRCLIVNGTRWEIAWDPESGAIYYINRTTQARQWGLPTENQLHSRVSMLKF